MYVYYEEDGDIKAGTLLADHESTVQIESQFGKRTKLKSTHVLLRFAAPQPSLAMEEARRLAAQVDADFLWEVAGEEEFGFLDLATEYHGRAPTPAEAGAILLVLHGAPIYFYKKGKGRYKAAPREALAAAKAALARRAREAAQRAEWARELQEGRLPEALRDKVYALIHKPDKNSLEYKALDDACAATGLSPARLFERCGALPSSHEFHLQAFLLEHFPRGIGFPALAPPPPPPPLPAADAPAFSIDDATTTEIDDAFSVIFRPDGRVRVGIHIAAPALGIAPESELDRIAASRLSTVYMPGDKITMLPEDLVDRYTLAEQRDCPAVSLYVEVGPDFAIQAMHTQADIVRIESNLRHETLEPVFNEASLNNPERPDYPFRRELEWLYAFACRLEAQRGKADGVARVDYLFKLSRENGIERVSILPRQRGNPIDKLVSELMILANSHWGQYLAEREIAGLYRVQTQGKVRMSVKPAPHEGLGVACYIWGTSPLRRYVDLINQRQILAACRGEKPPHAGNDARLFALLRDFELAYDAYHEFQRKMERYWCLRWFMQEDVHEIDASVIKENFVRFEGVPFITRVVGAPALQPGDRLRVALGDIDLLELELSCRYLAHLPSA